LSEDDRQRFGPIYERKLAGYVASRRADIERLVALGLPFTTEVPSQLLHQAVEQMDLAVAEGAPEAELLGLFPSDDVENVWANYVVSLMKRVTDRGEVMNGLQGRGFPRQSLVDLHIPSESLQLAATQINEAAELGMSDTELAGLFQSAREESPENVWA